MKSSIINHMNHDHRDALMVLVEYYKERKDILDAEMLDLNEDGMEILVNKNDKVQVPFSKKTKPEEVRLELMAMLKIARASLGKEKENESSKISAEVEKFISGFGSVVLGTVNNKAYPNVTYAPFLRYENNNYIYISEIGDHYDNMKNNGNLELLFLEDESKTKAITVRGRVRFASNFEFLPRDENFEKIMDAFEEKAGNTMNLMRKMKDFHLVKLNFLDGRYVKGFGQAYIITADGKIEQMTADKVAHRPE